MGGTPILVNPGQPGPQWPGEFESASIPNIVTFGFKNVAPPSPIYIQRDDVLVIDAISSVVETITVNVRLLLVPFEQGGQPDQSAGAPTSRGVIARGVIEPIQRAISLPTAYTPVFTQIPLTEGYLLAISGIGTAVSERGMSWVRAFLVRGAAAFPTPSTFETLFSDYVTASHPCGWPAGRNLFPTEGPGNLKTVSIGNPAAGADWIYTPSSATRTQFLSFDAQLVTSAAVANRIPRIQFIDSLGNLVAQCPPNAVIAASQTVQVTGYSDAMNTTADPSTVVIGLPGQAWLERNGQFKSNTVAIQAADQWSNIQIQVFEWIDNF